MHVQLSGQHLDIGEALQNYATDRLTEKVSTYFENAISANVHFVKQSYLYICDIIVNEGTGRNLVIKSNAESDEPYASFEKALSKLEKQLRRYKNKIKDHQKKKISQQFDEATNYVIDSSAEDSFEQGDNPVTIAESPVKIGNYTVSEAVMKMDLEDLPALMFKNSLTGRMNVVYYRKDGNIAWVDSK